MKIVKKFGGSTVSTLQNMKKIASYIKNDLESGIFPIIVVSAMGDKTDELISMAYNMSDKPNAKDLDTLLSTGEVVTSTLLSIALNNLGVKAESVSGSFIGIKTNGYYGLAKIEEIDTTYLKKLIKQGVVPVISGFQGVDKNNHINTLGRGGSDLSAIAIANALKIKTCELYKDVSGIYRVDPKIAKELHLLKELSLEETKEMSLTGAYVINTEATKLMDDIDLKIKNIFDPDKLETKISNNVKTSDRLSITYQKSAVKITGKENIKSIRNHDFSNLNIDKNSIIMSADDFLSISTHANFDEKNLERNLATISIIGKDTINNKKMIEKALSDRKEDILNFIDREISVTIVIKGDYLKDILNLLNETIFEGKK